MTAEISEIQRHMAQIRRDMHHEVQGAVRGAQSLTDWRSLVSNHPWLALGTAATVGYLVVPNRRRDAQTFVAVGPTANLVPPPAPFVRNAPPLQSATWNIWKAVYGLVAPVAMRAAQNYALQHLERLLAAHPFMFPDTPPSSEKAAGPGRPAAHPGPAARFLDARP
jgi:hypothetical protein